ncbi:MAG: hypothetical protein EPO42_13285 [Gallionellaceae bacterium]|nr:MAG: hypothetical protein EPO42_13285 [Gallionellaceae bacterium]
MSVGKTSRNAQPFTNVVGTGEATSIIPVGMTLNNLQLQLGFGVGGAFTKAMIDLIRIYANAKVIFEGTGTQIDKINAYRGQVSDASFLDVTFEDLTGLDQVDRVVGALDTSVGIAQLTTSVKINGATQPTLVGTAFETAPQRTASGAVSPFAGLIAKQLRYPFNTANGGTLPMLFPFGKNVGAVIKRVHIFHTNMTAAVVKEDSVVKFERTKARNEYEQKRHGRVPQLGMFTIDFIEGGNVMEAFDTRKAQSVDWLFDFSAADSGYVVIEYLDVLGNL